MDIILLPNYRHIILTLFWMEIMQMNRSKTQNEKGRVLHRLRPLSKSVPCDASFNVRVHKEPSSGKKSIFLTPN